jgi:hypothetical protein
VGVVQPDRLGQQVLFQTLVGFGLERRGILEDTRHVAALIEEAFAVELCRDGELEVVAMHGYRAFTLVAVGRKPTQVNHVVVRKQFSRVEPVEEFVVVGEQRFDTRRMQEQQPLRTIMTVAEDADVTVAPQRTRNHQMVHQIEACGVAVGSLYQSVTGMAVLSFAAAFRAPVKVEWQCPYRLGENTHASPYGRKVQRTLLGDIHFTGGIGNRIGRDDLVHCGLELGRGDVAPLFAPPERKPLH